MELMSHFEAGYDTRALDMIRSMWGFMLKNPSGPQSTFWEGYDSDGNLAYQGSFTSSSHGWGTGPTSALSFYVLGVQPDTAAGQTYRVVPHPGDLTHVEGSLTLSLDHAIVVDYDVNACKSFSMRVDASALVGSTGTIGVPKLGSSRSVSINGKVAWDKGAFIASPGVASATEDADYVYFSGVAPTVSTFSYSDANACPPPPEQWQFCADENGSCSFAGTKRVRFGKRGKYLYSIVSAGTACTVASFGGQDPLPNVAKSCQISVELYSDCAGEGALCSFTGMKQVRFGANGQWRTLTASGGTPCTAAAFGDPLPNVAKRCEVRDIP
jgi:hypothetical protein